MNRYHTHLIVVMMIIIQSSALADGITASPTNIVKPVGKSGTSTLETTTPDDPRTQEEAEGQSGPQYTWEIEDADDASPCTITGQDETATLTAGRTQAGTSDIDVKVTIHWPTKPGTGSVSDTVYRATVPVHGYTIDIVLYGRKKLAPTQRQEGEERYWFQTAEQVYFRAAINPDNQSVRDAIDAKCKWTLDPVAGVTGNNWDPIPDWGDGTHAKGIGTTASRIRFYLKVLPSGNGGFGEKNLGLVVEGEDISKTTTTRLFFERTGKKHPDPGQDQTANWHYYWSQEGNPAACEFSRDSSHAKYAKYWTNGTANGKYKSSEGPNGTIYLSDKAVTGDKIEGWDYSFPEGHQPQSGIVAFELDPETAPEFANLSYAHEATHRTLHLLGPLGTGTGPQDDQDQDGVPNGWEDAVAGMDKTKSNTFGNAFKLSAGSSASRDEEFYCVLGGVYQYGEFVAPGESVGAANYHGESPSRANNDNDWAEKGTQWNSSLE